MRIQERNHIIDSHLYHASENCDFAARNTNPTSMCYDVDRKARRGRLAGWHWRARWIDRAGTEAEVPSVREQAFGSARYV